MGLVILSPGLRSWLAAFQRPSQGPLQRLDKGFRAKRAPSTGMRMHPVRKIPRTVVPDERCPVGHQRQQPVRVHQRIIRSGQMSPRA